MPKKSLYRWSSEPPNPTSTFGFHSKIVKVDIFWSFGEIILLSSHTHKRDVNARYLKEATAFSFQHREPTFNFYFHVLGSAKCTNLIGGLHLHCLLWIGKKYWQMVEICEQIIWGLAFTQMECKYLFFVKGLVCHYVLIVLSHVSCRSMYLQQKIWMTNWHCSR